MKTTIVDPNGDVRCPVCGARNSFTVKRTGKAKFIGVATVGVGALAMPKRLQCNGCGANLKRADSVESKVDQQRQRSGERLEGLKDDHQSKMEIRKDASLSPQERAATFGNPLDRKMAELRYRRQDRRSGR